MGENVHEKESALVPEQASPNVLDVDDFLERIGSFGRYQIRMFAFMAFMKVFGDGLQVMIPTFLAAEPPWRCAPNSTGCNVSGSISPGHAHYKIRCGLSRGDWEFDTTQFDSIVSQWDLVCARSSLSSLSKSVVFAGYLVGVMFGGIISDKFGRKSVVYFPSVLGNILALIASFANSFWLFTLLRVLVGVCIGSSSLAMFVLLVEYSGIRRRAWAGTTIWYFWVLSLMLLALLAYLVRDWRDLSITGAAPGLLQVFFWWYIPESARWLIVKGKPEKAVEMLKKLAEFNRKEMPTEPLATSVPKQRTGDLRDLFRTWKTAYRTVVSCVCWIVVSLVYYGVSFSAGNFGGNRYLVFFLVSIVEFPSNWTAIKFMDRFGRKKTTIIGLIASSIFSTCAVLLQRSLADTGFLVGRIIMSMSAKFFINISYCAIYIYTAELFPTVVRNIALGTSSACARIGSITAPFVVWLVRIHVILPYSFMAACAFICAVLCMTLPETKDTHAPQVFEASSGLPEKEKVELKRNVTSA